MAEYNIHKPDIVGNEWVPIVDASYQPDVTIERGYSFAISQTTGVAAPVVNRGVYHLEATPTGVTTSQCPFVTLYRKGGEYPIGPLQKVILPCSSATNAGPNGGFFGDLSGSAALQNPSDGSGFSFSQGTVSTTANGNLTLAFDTTGAPTMGRIFNVSLLFTVDGNTLRFATLPNSMLISIRYKGVDFFYSTGVMEPAGQSLRGDLNFNIGRISFGEINPNWSDATFTATNDRYPWTQTRLNLFDESSGDPMRVRFAWQADTTPLDDPGLYYAAMEVTYATFENRLAYGGKHIGIDQDTTVFPSTVYAPGANFVMLRTANTLVTGSGLVLSPGEYTVTYNLADYGDTNQPIFGLNAAAATNTRPTVNASRELYPVESVQGVELERVFTTDDVFQKRDTRVITTVGIAVTGAGNTVHSSNHGYTSPIPAPTIILSANSQSFTSENNDGSLPYPWVRYYARQSGGPEGVGTIALRYNGSLTQVVRITGAELAALPEIANGWREVTLRFATGLEPVMDGTSTIRTWEWILEDISTTSGQGVSYDILAGESSLALANANYETSVRDATIPLLSPVSSDFTFLSSTDPAPVTGMAVTTASVALTGIATECSTTPACVPTAAPYNRITWPIPNGGTVVSDTFDRAVSSGWGTSSSGQAWTTSGGAASDYSVSVTGSWGIQTHTSVNVARTTLIGSTTLRDFDITTDFITPSADPTGAPVEFDIVGRWVDASNFYVFRVRVMNNILSTPYDIEVSMGKFIAGVFTQIGNVYFTPSGVSLAVNDRFRMRAMMQGSSMFMKVWDADDNAEPADWSIRGSDTALTQGQVGLRSILATGNTNTLPVQMRFDSFTVSPPLWNFGYYELQRSDDDTDWQTILKATSPAATGFSDFEARIGMRSDYRIRSVNLYEFPGPWSATVSNTLASSVTDGHGLLVFTTNTNQTHGQSLAYEEVWSGNPSQEFKFFEGDGMVQFQRMFTRDFQVGFHGTERGGVQFERTLLVQNAAVAPPILDNAFRSLRDLAWDDLPYVCVRTNVGDRWYAVVEVPSGVISRARRLQLVQVRITEVSETPYVVDSTGG